VIKEGQQMNMHHAIINIMIFLGIVFGAIECFFGYRIFKIILGILGFAAGAALAMFSFNSISQNEIVMFLSGLVGGIIGAVMTVWLYFFGVFMIGALGGGVIGNAVFAAIQMYPATFAVLVIAICCGVLALIFSEIYDHLCHRADRFMAYDRRHFLLSGWLRLPDEHGQMVSTRYNS
jgi:MFS family permease